MQNEKRYFGLVISALVLTGIGALLTGLILYGVQNPSSFSSPEPAPSENAVPDGPLPEQKDAIVDGLDLGSGLVAEGDYLLVKATCTACHSGKLVTQNRATREGWEEMIRWMQRTQKLWDLGETEGPILDYLAEHYAPEQSGRRRNLVVEEWYDIP